MRITPTRIAYLKRMLKRLEGGDARIRHLISSAELSAADRQLRIDLLSKAGDEAVEQLRTYAVDGGTKYSDMAERLATRTSVRVQDSPAEVLRRERDQR
jgi:hypothetical protein